MAAPAVVPGARSAFGIGLEAAATPGTAVTASRWAPFADLTPTEQLNPLIDTGMRGAMGVEADAVMGTQHSELSFSMAFNPECTGDLLYNIMSGYSVGAAVSGVYPHTISVLNSGTAQGRTHTFVDFQNLTASTGARVYPYARLSELTFSGNAEGLVMTSGKLSASASAAAGAGPTNAPTADQVIPAWRSSLTIAAAAMPNLSEWSVTIARAVIVQDGADGTQTPYVIAQGPITSVTGKYTFVAIDESPLTSAIAGTKSANVLTIDNGGATSAVRQLVLTMTKCQFTDPQMKRDQSGLIMWDVNFRAFLNSTDVGASGGLAPIKAVLKTAIADYTA